MKTVAVIAPAPIRGSGGVARIYSFANALQAAGYECDVLVFDAHNKSALDLKEEALRYYGVANLNFFTHLDQMRNSFDIVLATRWDTPAISLKMKSTHKLYLIQDYEACFNSVGDGSIFAENSYLLGLQPLTYGRWLAQKMKVEFGSEPYHFDFTSDTTAFHCSNPMEQRLTERPSIAFVYQSDKTRRCPWLGVEALGIVSSARPDVELNFVGSDHAPKLWYNFNNIGNTTIHQLNSLYNRSHIGLSLSSTNPSCNAFDMMAAGLPSVDLYRENNLLDVPSGGVLLAHQTPESIAEAILHLLSRPDELITRSRYGIRFMESRPQAQEIEKFVALVQQITGGSKQTAVQIAPISPAYTDPPVVAKVNRNPSVKAYLETQRRLFRTRDHAGNRRKMDGLLQWFRRNAASGNEAYYTTDVSYFPPQSIGPKPYSRKRYSRLVQRLIKKFGLDPRLSADLFDSVYYLLENEDVELAGVDPLTHFIRHGIKEGRSPSPLFDKDWYAEAYPEGGNSGNSAILNYIIRGSAMNRSPNPAFDSIWYLSRYTDVRDQGIHPLLHYIIWGEAEERSPSEHFSPTWYLKANPDVATAGVSPLEHYVRYGRREGRSAVPQPVKNVKILNSYAGTILKDTENVFLHSSEAGDFEPEFRREEIRILGSSPSDGLVSFDVWSTIIHRRCHPDEIKLRSARFLLLNAWTDILPGLRSCITLMNARMRAENSSAPKGDYEYRFSDAIAVWLGDVLYRSCSQERRDELRNLILKHEFVAECESIELDENVAGTIRSLPRSPIFISDFYMESSFIQGLLQHVGIGAHFMRGYASCDTFENKRSGALFKRVLADFDLPPCDLTHIGDNPLSDLDRPLSLGIKALRYVSHSAENRNAWYTDAFHALCVGDSSLHQKRLLALTEVTCDEIPSNFDQNSAELYRAGRRIGLLAFGYCLNIMQDAISGGFNEVAFFAREGIFFQKVYDAIAANDPFTSPVPPSKLVYVSRRATFAASLRSYDNDEFMRLWTMYWRQSPLAFAKSLNLSEIEAKSAADRVGISADKVVEAPWKDPLFQAFLSDPIFKQYATQELKKQRDLLKNYLEQELGADCQKLLVSDIGWRGTIQDNLAHLLGVPITGHYLALFGYLNPQASGSSKVGWLCDDNGNDGYSLPDHVSALEMIFNGPGGSTVGYRQLESGRISPVREVYKREEESVAALDPLHQGIISVVPSLARYVKLHGLIADDLRALSRKVASDMLKSPPAVIADIFGQLEHNETFGVGSVEVMSATGLDRAVQNLEGPDLHYALSSWLGTRWPSGMSRQSVVKDWWEAASMKSRSCAPIEITKACSPALSKAIGSRASLYVPKPLRASGGFRTIANMARGLADVGFNVEIHVEEMGQEASLVEEYMDGIPVTIFPGWTSNRPSNVSLATISHSAQYVAKNVISNYKFYLVQDNEAFFHPLGDAYLGAEHSFTLGLHHLTIGNWLSHFIQRKYGVPAYPSGFGVDTTTYRMLDSQARERAVCMLYQPEKPWRGNALGLQALSMIKKRLPDAKIYIFGSDIPPEVDFEFEHLGVVNKLNDLNALYNKCRVGICLSLSNPSRIPFEMAASGCKVVDIYRYNNLMDQSDKMSRLAYQSPASIADAVGQILNVETSSNKEVSEVVGLASVRTSKWEVDSFVANLLGIVEDKTPMAASLSPVFNGKPVIAAADDNAASREFCRQQWHEATAT